MTGATERAATHGGPAYPIESYLVNGIMQAEGMTMRDRFALTAMGGLLAADKDCEWKPHQVSERSYEIADAMLKRKEETDPLPYDRSQEWSRDENVSADHLLEALREIVETDDTGELEYRIRPDGPAQCVGRGKGRFAKIASAAIAKATGSQA